MKKLDEIRLVHLETSSVHTAITFSSQERCLLNSTYKVSLRQAAILVPLIEQGLQALNWDVKDVDAIVVNTGPGSYTGLRVGVSTAKGLAYGLQIPIIPLTTFELLYESAVSSGLALTHNLCLQVDARRMDAWYILVPPGQTATGHPQFGTLSVSWLSELNTLHSGPWAFIGAGSQRIKSLLPQDSEIILHSEYPQPQNGILPALRKYQNWKLVGGFPDIAYIEPNYGKPPHFTQSVKVE